MVLGKIDMPSTSKAKTKTGHKAWRARLAWFLKFIGVLRCEEMDKCNPPDLVAQAVLHWATGTNSYMRVLQCKTLAYNTFVPSRWVNSLVHILICVLGCAFHNRWC
jgi:hypothetical protein